MASKVKYCTSWHWFHFSHVFIRPTIASRISMSMGNLILSTSMSCAVLYYFHTKLFIHVYNHHITPNCSGIYYLFHTPIHCRFVPLCALLFQVFVNGSHFCDYDHRIDLRSVSHIFIDGDAKFSDVGFKAYFVSWLLFDYFTWLRVPCLYELSIYFSNWQGAKYNSIIPQQLVAGSWVSVTVAVHDKPHRWVYLLAVSVGMIDGR